MIIELSKEEVEFLERACRTTIVFAELNDVAFNIENKSDIIKAKRLLDKFVKARCND